MDGHEKMHNGNQQFEPLAIVGMGCLFPKANSLRAYWANIKNAVDAIREIPESHWRADDYHDTDQKRPDFTYGRTGGFLEPIDFDPMAYGMPPNTLEGTDTSQLLGMVAAERALQDAGYDAAKAFDRDRTSVILGVTGALELVIPLGARLGHPLWRRALDAAGVDAATTDDVVQRIGEQYVSWQEASFPGLLGNVVAGRITKHLDLGGTNCVVDAACASSLSAIHLAALELQAGHSDMVITGGVDTFNDVFMYMCFSKTPALSPTGHARPFDAAGDGTILGEGLGMLVIKRLADAERDGDRIYACIRGIGASSDGKGDAIYAPSAKGQTKALRRAYANAGFPPETVELVEAHGTGTAAGDNAELSALREVYGDSATGPWCALGSVKSQIGHTKAAAGAAGLIKAALALYCKVLPPTIKVSEPLPALKDAGAPLYLNTEKRPWLATPEHPRRAALSALGFGGSNFHLVLEEHGARKQAPDWDGDVELLAYAAETVAALRGAVEQTLAGPADNWEALLREGARLREAFAPGAQHRLIVLIRQGQDTVKTLREALGQLEERPAAPWILPGGTVYGIGAAAGTLAFVFPGQGTQQPGMLRDLACAFPEFLETLEAADAAFAQAAPDAVERLSNMIYPRPVFDPEARAAQEGVLRDTQVAQPAIGAVSAGAARVLARFGIQPEACAGHSYGELVALHAAGVMDLDTLIRLSRVRGTLMAQGAGNSGMIAVRASVAQVEEVLRETGLSLTVANKNAPEQTVISGAKDVLDQAAAAFKARGLSATPLAVAAGFHSAFVSEASGPFLDALRAAEIGGKAAGDGSEPASPVVYGNTTAAPYPTAPDALREQLAAQLARPVEFIAQITRMHEDGVRTFVEVGPGARMTGLVQAILKGQEFQAMALDTSGPQRGGVESLARLLAQIAAAGHPVDLREWNAGCATPAPAKKPRMTVKICGANYVTPKPARDVMPAPAAATPPASTTPAALPAGGAPREQAMTTPHTPQPPAPPNPGPQPPVAAATQAAWQANEQHLIALQRLQEQTAQLHRQFLEGQQAALATFQMLLQQRPSTPGASAPHAAVPAAHVDPVPTPVVTPPIALQGAADAPPPHTLPAPASNEPEGAVQQVAQVLLATIAEKTGYPVEMLELGMSLDADLGIDSIKRVEILSALREQLPDAPEIGAEQLGTLQTLQHIVDYLCVNAAQTQHAMTEPGPRADTGQQAAQVLLATIAEKTGYPVEMLELGMSLDADLGIDSIKRVEILSALREQLPDAPEIGAEQLGTLQTLQHIVDYLCVNAAQTQHAMTEPGPRSDTGQQAAQVLLATIAEKTGYPVEMLELGMSLDADLGIDSIKRVEILSALREQLPDAPEIGAEQLGTLQTLQHIVDYLCANAAQAQTDPEPPSGMDAIQQAAADRPDAGMDCVEVAPEEVRSVERMVISCAALEGSPASAQGSQAPVAPVWITEDGAGIASALAETLRALGWPAEVVHLHAPPAVPQALGGVVLLAPVQTDDAFLLQSFQFTQQVAAALRAARGPQPFYVTASRLDGCFGFRGSVELRAALGGGLAGLAKTAHHEWPEVRCQALDLAPDFDAAAAAQAIAGELRCNGPREVGLAPEGRFWLQLSPSPAAPLNGLRPIAAGEPVVITGGARGVTAEVALALAQQFQPVLVLLGRSALPEQEPEWLRGLADEPAIKRGLMQQGCTTPKEIAARAGEILAHREIRANIARMEAAGARVRYFSVDVRDTAAVERVIAEVRTAYGPIRGLVHGAGVITDKLIQDKTAEQWLNVYETKVQGARALLQATAHDPLTVLVLFSSSTGRYGRRGQADYAMANEVLNKLAQVEQRRRPECRVVSINWGPWEGGMVTPALRKVFEEEGVGLIDLEVGARYLVQEISQDKERPAEVVIFGFPVPGRAPRPASVQTPAHLSVAFSMDLSVAAFPFLRSHVIKGKAVLPVAMLLEWFAHAAVHANPGLRFHGVNGLRVLRGVTLGAEESRSLRFLAGKATQREDQFVVPVELRGAGADGAEVLHASAEILLTTALPASPAAPELTVGELLENGFAGRSYYGDGALFHGDHFQTLAEVAENAHGIITATAHPAPAPAQWIARPLRNTWLSDPLAVDAALQLNILWTLDHLGAASLPSHVREYRQYRAFPKEAVQIVLRVEEHTPQRCLASVEFLDGAGSLIARMRGYESTVEQGLSAAFAQNTL